MATTASFFETPGPIERRRIRLGILGGSIPIVLLLALAAFSLHEQGLFNPERWEVLKTPDLLEALGKGLWATIKVAIVCVLLSLVVGLLLALGRLSHRKWLNTLCRIWIEALRGLPELLLVFFIYLGIPAVTGWSINTFWALVVGLVLYESTAMSEVFRSGFMALPRGQTEAAHALGLRTVKTLRFIQLPQVVKLVLPSLVSEMVRVTKASSLGFVIGYTDLLLTGEHAIEFLGGEYAVPIFAAIALIYVVICLLLGKISSLLSQRVS